MAPLVQSWPSRQLPEYAQVTPQGQRRKNFDGNLKACELLEMLQYECKVENPENRESPTRCYPILRLFRRCQDTVKGEKRHFLVETTSWEGPNAKSL